MKVSISRAGLAGLAMDVSATDRDEPQRRLDKQVDVLLCPADVPDSAGGRLWSVPAAPQPPERRVLADLDVALDRIYSLPRRLRLGRDTSELLTHLGDDPRRPVFKLSGWPDYVFKSQPVWGCGGDAALRTRFDNSVRGRQVVEQLGLDLLHVPAQWWLERTIGGRKISVIGEASMPIDPEMSAQEELYRRHDACLTPNFAQLARFVLATGFQDVDFRNIPLLNLCVDHAAPSPTSALRVALVDLEHMDTAHPLSGLAGDPYRGVLRCATPRHFCAIAAEAEHAGLEPAHLDRMRQAQRAREQELEDDAAMMRFYREKGIVGDPGRHIAPVRVADLSLRTTDFCANCTPSRIQEAVDAIVEAINGGLDSHRHLPDALVKQRRSLVLDGNRGRLAEFARLHQHYRSIHAGTLTRRQIASGSLIQQVLDQMAARHLIYGVSGSNAYGYFLQA